MTKRRQLRDAVLAGAIALASTAFAQTRPVLTGTFVQLNYQLAMLGEDGWRAELEHMRSVGFDTLIVQYARYGEVSYFPTIAAIPGAPPPAAALPPNESIATLAWQADAPAKATHLRILVTPNSKEWTMIPEVRVLDQGRDVVAGRGYVLTPGPSGTYLDPDAATGGKLTDGSANFAWSDMVGWQSPGGEIVVDFDLGEPTAFDRVEVQFMRSDVSAVELPAAVAVAVSGDGSRYLNLGQPAGWNAGTTAGTDMGTWDPIGELLAAAEGAGFRVWLGLALDPAYWEGKFDPTASSASNTALMLELERLYGASPALVGYYLPEEIDDRSFVTPAAHEAMTTYLAAMADAAHTQVGRPVMVAPYFGMRPDGAAYAAWWDTTLAQADLDVIAMQDGVGTRRTTVAEGVPVYRALKAVTDAHGVELWSDLEVFEQTHGWPVDDLAWQATSAKMATVRSQLELEAPFVAKFVAFAFPDHMSPRAGGAAAQLYQDYLAYLKELDP
ncbi:MAG: DUF4434 domain-containing protein [Trueperaceae bacterium]|nr:DUF4434 domain-containing protein [Trueperaceae bacterium]